MSHAYNRCMGKRCGESQQVGHVLVGDLTEVLHGSLGNTVVRRMLLEYYLREAGVRGGRGGVTVRFACRLDTSVQPLSPQPVNPAWWRKINANKR
jgi:hypothetical protein